MAFIYITGAPGVGKSTIQKELLARGFDTYDIDDAKFGGPYNKASGEKVTIPPAKERESNWFDKHEWRINRAAFEELQLKSKDTDIIICGVAQSDSEIIDLFDKIIYLHVSNQELKKRLLSRTHNDYGNNESEHEDILKRKQKLDIIYSEASGCRLNASDSLDKTVSKLLGRI